MSLEDFPARRAPTRDGDELGLVRRWPAPPRFQPHVIRWIIPEPQGPSTVTSVKCPLRKNGENNGCDKLS